jgi:hypothetical protein
MQRGIKVNVRVVARESKSWKGTIRGAKKRTYHLLKFEGNFAKFELNLTKCRIILDNLDEIKAFVAMRDPDSAAGIDCLEEFGLKDLTPEPE